MKRKTLFILGAIVALVLVAMIVLPLFIDANQFKPMLETSMDNSLGRTVHIGNIRISIFSGGAVIEDLSISDNPAFSHSAFLQAKAVNVGVDLLPLIFSRKLQVRSFAVVEPEVTLLRSPSGVWNFSTLGASAKSKKDDSPGTDFSVQSLSISKGRITIGSTGSRAKNQVYEDVNLEATNLSYTSEFPFSLSARTPGNGTLKLEGKAGPINRTDAAETPLHAKLDVQHLDLASTGFLDPASGIAGLANFAGDLQSDGRQLNSKGKVKAEKLQLVRGGAPARVPVEIAYSTDYDVKRQAGELRQGDVRVGEALAHLTGSYNTGGESTSVQMKLDGQNLPAQDLEAVLPAMGIILPSGASLRGGTVSTALALSGALDRLVTTGTVNVSNTKLAGFNLGSKMGAVASFAGLNTGSDLLIQMLSSNLRVAPEGIRADNINLILPALGSLTGNGTISSNQALNFRMIAHLANSNSPLGGLANIASLGQKNKGEIPFMIQGTASNPVFVPDVMGAVGGLANPAGLGGLVNTPTQDVGGILGGLFGKKKKP